MTKYSARWLITVSKYMINITSNYYRFSCDKEIDTAVYMEKIKCGTVDSMTQ